MILCSKSYAQGGRDLPTRLLSRHIYGYLYKKNNRDLCRSKRGQKRFRFCPLLNECVFSMPVYYF